MSVTTRARSSYCVRNDHLGCKTAKARCECACHPVPEARRPKPNPKRVEGAVRRHARKREAVSALVRPWITKEQAACCSSKRDALGRLPIGYCGPDCIRRPR